MVRRTALEGLCKHFYDDEEFSTKGHALDDEIEVCGEEELGYSEVMMSVMNIG